MIIFDQFVPVKIAGDLCTYLSTNWIYHHEKKVEQFPAVMGPLYPVVQGSCPFSYWKLLLLPTIPVPVFSALCPIWAYTMSFGVFVVHLSIMFQAYQKWGNFMFPKNLSSLIAYGRPVWHQEESFRCLEHNLNVIIITHYYFKEQCYSGICSLLFKVRHLR